MVVLMLVLSSDIRVAVGFSTKSLLLFARSITSQELSYKLHDLWAKYR